MSPRDPELDAQAIASEFVRAARAQAGALAATDYQTVVVPHPIQPLTREEVRALADKAFDAILRRITA